VKELRGRKNAGMLLSLKDVTQPVENVARKAEREE